MRGIHVSRQVTFSLILVSLFSVLLSGCLVENSDPIPVKGRTDDTLRTILSGERLVYELTGQRSINNVPTPITGTMTVEWTNDIIPDPHNSSVDISVIREQTVADFDDGLSTTTIRYLTQDANGSIFVHAYRQKNNLVYTGIYVTDPAQTSVSYSPIEMVKSPITAMDSTLSYRLFQSCGNAATCPLSSSLRQITEGIEFLDDVPVTTNAGKSYQSFYFTYTGSFLEDNSTPFIEPFDFRTSCAAIPSTNSITGEYYYYPEVGLIKFLSSCEGVDPTSGNTLGHRITGVLLSASFPLP